MLPKADSGLFIQLQCKKFQHLCVNFRMFSFKELKETSRTFAIVEEVKTGKAQEVVYFTTWTRNDVIPEDAQEDYHKTLGKYSQSNGALDPKYQFKILPNSTPVEGFERDAIYVSGQAGSGKSWQIGNYIEKYHRFYPDNTIMYVSVNNIENDPSLDKVTALRRIVTDPKTGKDVEVPVVQQINLMSIESVIDHKTWHNVLFVFDDIIDIKPTVNPDEIVNMLNEEEKKKFIKTRMTLKERESLENYVLRKMKRCVGYIRDSIGNLLNGGRKNRISVVVVDHKLNTGPVTCAYIAQCTTFWLFPYSNNSKRSLKTWLISKVSFDEEEADKVANMEFLQFDFLYVNRAGKKFCMTPDRLILFD